MNFKSQSEIVVDTLVKRNNMTKEQAVRMWFNSRTYNEILRRNITYISAMRAYFELELEINNDPDWMRKEFE